MAPRRRRVPPKVESEVLIESRRRCALCYGLQRDSGYKRGQIAHVDRDPANSAKANLAYLCLEHHDEYDTRPSQGKGLTPGELVQYRAGLLTAVAEGRIAVAESGDQRQRRRRAHYRRISLDLFDRRIVIYRACRDYLNAIVREADIAVETLFTLTRDTEEAIFLFDEALHEYILELYRKGVALRREGVKAKMRPESVHPDVLWATFEAAFDALLKEAERVRHVFKPYLHV